jgi:DNA-binding NarL/FixJ family response regulator
MRIIIADDHELYLAGTRRCLEGIAQVEIVAEAVNGEQALSFCKNLRPDVLFLDVQMPGSIKGIQVLTQLQGSGIKIIGLSAYENPEYIRAFKELGAVAYMSKSEANQQNLTQVLQHIQQKTEFWLSIELADKLLSLQKQLDAYQLSPTEFELIPHIQQGNSAKQIAEKRFKSERTIINQLDSLRSKTNSATYPELVAWANKFILGDI